MICTLQPHSYKTLKSNKHYEGISILFIKLAFEEFTIYNFCISFAVLSGQTPIQYLDDTSQSLPFPLGGNSILQLHRDMSNSSPDMTSKEFALIHLPFTHFIAHLPSPQTNDRMLRGVRKQLCCGHMREAFDAYWGGQRLNLPSRIRLRNGINVPVFRTKLGCVKKICFLLNIGQPP